jgi:hypothetical protein
MEGNVKVIVFWNKTPCSPVDFTKVSEELPAFIFRVGTLPEFEEGVRLADLGADWLKHFSFFAFLFLCVLYSLCAMCPLLFL